MPIQMRMFEIVFHMVFNTGFHMVLDSEIDMGLEIGRLIDWYD